ncbi:MAG: ABC transporter permease, partial [Gemmatimonadetes bacterium]|nr:ABC transporter permease [Gemmatimonadota bacterium]
MSRVAEGIYRAALRLLPEPFRARHGEELEHVYRQRLADARARSGRAGTAARVAGETLDVLSTAVRLRVGRPRPVPRQTRKGTPVRGFVQDLRHAARGLLLRPSFTLTAVLTVALGIGSTTAIFTVADAVLLRPLPYPESDRLAHVRRVVERYGMERAPLSYPDFVDLREGTRSFEAVSAFAFESGTLLGEGDPERLVGARLEGGMFDLLRVPVALGRPLQPADGAPGAESVVVLSDALWQRRFGADPGVVGGTVELGGTPRRVVGVAPSGFRFPAPAVEYWVPLTGDSCSAERDCNYLQVLVRLRAGVSTGAAEADLRAALSRIQEANPGANE